MESKPVIGKAATWLVICSIVGALYLAADVLIPIAVATLVAFALAPVVKRLVRLGLARLVATTLTMLGVAILVAGIGWMLSGQVRGFVEHLPEYRWNLRVKVADVRETLGSRVEEATSTIRELGQDLSNTERGTPSPPPVAPAPIDALPTVQDALGSLMGVSIWAGFVFLLAFVMSLRWEDLHERALALVGESELTVTTRASQEASARITLYLRRQLLINVLHGTIVGLVTWWIGVPNPLVWGILAASLRFVPYVGAIVSTGAPILVSCASSEGWTQTWITASALLLLEILTNNLVEPWIYGSCTGLSPLALLVSATFWAWLWGPVGLVISTPMTVCLIVVGKNFQALRFLDVLFGVEPPLRRESRLFPRLLACDADRSWEIVDSELSTGTALEMGDEVLLPALSLVRTARKDGRVDAETVDRIGGVLERLLDEVDDLRLSIEPPAPTGTARVLCLPARDALDAAAARLLETELRAIGCPVERRPHGQLTSEVAQEFGTGGFQVLAVCAIAPPDTLHLRSLCKRLLQAHPAMRVVLCLLGERVPHPGSPSFGLGREHVEVVTSLRDAIAWISGPVRREVPRLTSAWGPGPDKRARPSSSSAGR